MKRPRDATDGDISLEDSANTDNALKDTATTCGHRCVPNKKLLRTHHRINRWDALLSPEIQAMIFESTDFNPWCVLFKADWVPPNLAEKILRPETTLTRCARKGDMFEYVRDPIRRPPNAERALAEVALRRNWLDLLDSPDLQVMPADLARADLPEAFAEIGRLDRILWLRSDSPLRRNWKKSVLDHAARGGQLAMGGIYDAKHEFAVGAARSGRCSLLATVNSYWPSVVASIPLAALTVPSDRSDADDLANENHFAVLDFLYENHPAMFENPAAVYSFVQLAIYHFDMPTLGWVWRRLSASFSLHPRCQVENESVADVVQLLLESGANTPHEALFYVMTNPNRRAIFWLMDNYRGSQIEPCFFPSEEMLDYLD
ncbi:hypothetical protein DFJ73DRAFT_776421 [Zopfochytrium polystomum]|nr:hypothetical protein DFJ73DRAFT_776421 [Zopfochytrium polystomum]